MRNTSIVDIGNFVTLSCPGLRYVLLSFMMVLVARAGDAMPPERLSALALAASQVGNDLRFGIWVLGSMWEFVLVVRCS